MELIQVMLFIMMMACFYEWHHLSRNTIRHDEVKYFVIAVILLIALVYTFFIGGSETL